MGIEEARVVSRPPQQPCVQYRVRLLGRAGGGERLVWKRYSEFVALRKAMKVSYLFNLILVPFD